MIWLKCKHKRLTFPQTPRSRIDRSKVKAAEKTGMYVVCLDCGKEMAYDWHQMKIIEEKIGDLDDSISWKSTD